MKILVTGGTGSVGRKLVPKLQAKRAEVYVLTRKTPNDPMDGINYVTGDMLDPGSMLSALNGIDKLFLLNAVAAEEQTQTLIALGMAKRADVRHVTYLSVLAADRFPDVPHFASKVVSEAALRDSGLAYTILRPGFYYQNDLDLKGAIVGAGMYPLPIGSQGISATDVEDIAEAAAISLIAEGHEGETYDIASPQKIAGPANAETWGRLLGKPVRYIGEDFDRFEEQMRAHMEPWKAYDLRVMFQGFKERGFVAPQSDIDRLIALLGRQPRSYEEFATETAKQWTAAKA